MLNAVWTDAKNWLNNRQNPEKTEVDTQIAWN